MTMPFSSTMPTEFDDIRRHPDYLRLIASIDSLTSLIDEGDVVFVAAQNAIPGVPIGFTSRFRILYWDNAISPDDLSRTQYDSEFNDIFVASERAYKVRVLNEIFRIIPLIDTSNLGSAWDQIAQVYDTTDSGFYLTRVSEDVIDGLDPSVLSTLAGQVLEERTGVSLEELYSNPLEELSNLVNQGIPHEEVSILLNAARYGTAVEQDAAVTAQYQQYVEMITSFEPDIARSALAILNGIIESIPGNILGFDSSFVVNKLREFSGNAAASTDYLEDVKNRLIEIESATEFPFNTTLMDLRQRILDYIEGIPGTNLADYDQYLSDPPTREQLAALISAAEDAATAHMERHLLIEPAFPRTIVSYEEGPLTDLGIFREVYRGPLRDFQAEFDALFSTAFDWMGVVGFIAQAIIEEASDFVAILIALSQGDFLGAALNALPAGFEQAARLVAGLRRQAQRLRGINDTLNNLPLDLNDFDNASGVPDIVSPNNGVLPGANQDGGGGLINQADAIDGHADDALQELENLNPDRTQQNIGNNNDPTKQNPPSALVPVNGLSDIQALAKSTTGRRSTEFNIVAEAWFKEEFDHVLTQGELNGIFSLLRRTDNVDFNEARDFIAAIKSTSNNFNASNMLSAYVNTVQRNIFPSVMELITNNKLKNPEQLVSFLKRPYEHGEVNELEHAIRLAGEGNDIYFAPVKSHFGIPIPAEVDFLRIDVDILIQNDGARPRAIQLKSFEGTGDINRQIAHGVEQLELLSEEYSREIFINITQMALTGSNAPSLFVTLHTATEQTIVSNSLKSELLAELLKIDPNIAQLDLIRIEIEGGQVIEIYPKGG